MCAIVGEITRLELRRRSDGRWLAVEPGNAVVAEVEVNGRKVREVWAKPGDRIHQESWCGSMVERLLGKDLMARIPIGGGVEVEIDCYFVKQLDGVL